METALDLLVKIIFPTQWELNHMWVWVTRSILLLLVLLILAVWSLIKFCKFLWRQTPMLRTERILLWLMAAVVAFLAWQNYTMRRNNLAQAAYNEDVGSCVYSLTGLNGERQLAEQCGTLFGIGSRGWEPIRKAILEEKAKEEAEGKALRRSLEQQEKNKTQK